MKDLPELFIEDMAETYAQLKKARSKPMRFYFLSATKPTDPGWLLVGRAGALARRFKEARKHVGTPPRFQKGRSMAGRLELQDNRLVFHIEEEDGATAEELARTGKRLAVMGRGHEDSSTRQTLLRLATLIEKCHAQREGESTATEPVAPETYRELIASDSGAALDLKEIFGEEADEIETVAQATSQLLQQVEEREPAAKVHELVQQLASASTPEALLTAFRRNRSGLVAAWLDPLATDEMRDLQIACNELGWRTDALKSNQWTSEALQGERIELARELAELRASGKGTSADEDIDTLALELAKLDLRQTKVQEQIDALNDAIDRSAKRLKGAASLTLRS